MYNALVADTQLTPSDISYVSFVPPSYSYTALFPTVGAPSLTNNTLSILFNQQLTSTNGIFMQFKYFIPKYDANNQSVIDPVSASYVVGSMAMSYNVMASYFGTVMNASSVVISKSLKWCGERNMRDRQYRYKAALHIGCTARLMCAHVR